MIERDLTSVLLKAAGRAPVVTLTGPRQSGKTTLCRALFGDRPYASLEAPEVRAFAAEDPRGFLAQFPEGAVFDEIQRVPDLLSHIQGIVDDDPAHGRWILTGSQNFSLRGAISQSLAGRTDVLELLTLTWGEIQRFRKSPASLDEALLTSGFPRIFDRELEPAPWLRAYVNTHVERDVRQILGVGDLVAFQRFLELCAGRTGQLLNLSSLAGDCGVSQPTARAWLSVLEASYIVFRLPPFHANLRKRLVKAPKLMFHDAGLACWLLGIHEPHQLRTHPLRGAIFETWVVSEVMKLVTNRGAATRRDPGLSFYRDRSGAEVDLVIERPDRLTLLECKSAATPSAALLAGARRVAGHFAGSGRPVDLAVVYGGDEEQRRTAGWIVPWRSVGEVVFPDGQGPPPTPGPSTR